MKWGYCMKRVFLLGLFLLFLNTSTYAQRVSPTTGNTLLEACESKAELQQAFWLGYITGSTDVDGMNGAAFPERRRSCIPESVSNSQIRDVVVKYLKEHPEDRHLLAEILVVQALAKTFPCRS
jgi:hypothetical protein